MPSLIFDVDDPIPQELDFIKVKEGFGNRKSTFTFLIKYYLLTKNTLLETSIQNFKTALSKIDLKKLPSAKEQLKDV